VIALPGINQLIEIVLADGALFPSRVEDVVGGRYMVAAPLAAVETPTPGSSLALAWVAEQSRYALQVVWLGLTKQHPPRWEVEVAGEPRLQSRRRYVRGGGGEPVVLRGVGEVPDRTVLAGEIIDLSESALRFRARDTEYVPGDEVNVGFQLQEHHLETLGRVQALRPVDGGAVDVVVDFEIREDVARAIRHYVYQRQLAERRARRLSA
jgi:hypothetical protein